MNKNELKKVLKPLIKECIKEVLFEEKGALSHIISEVANGLVIGTPKSVVTERKRSVQDSVSFKNKIPDREQRASKANKALKEHKKKLLDAIGSDAYGGVNIFEGTTPAPAPVSNGSAQGPLSSVDPKDPGVDISNIFSGKSAAIFNKMMGKK
jgi:hypothetical protein